jgi:hypothetical protein
VGGLRAPLAAAREGRSHHPSPVATRRTAPHPLLHRKNYALEENGRRCLALPDGSRFFFPKRIPKNVPFKMAALAPPAFLPGMSPEDDPFWKTPVADQYAALYSDAVVGVIATLFLPRYGLALYLDKNAAPNANAAQQDIIADLSRAGKRMLGFCRTGLFKRLESSGHTFILSVCRHILRNQVHLHALAGGLEIPVGSQESAAFDDGSDEGIDDVSLTPAEAYRRLRENHADEFDWLPASFFTAQLQKNLQSDADALARILKKVGDWQTADDGKLAAQVSPDAAKDNLGIEPLPDMDFNIRPGNTLVGYATYEEVKRAVTSAFDFDNVMEKIATRAADVQQIFDIFRQRQTEGDGSVPAADKQTLQTRLTALREELNRHLASDHGVDANNEPKYNKWLTAHQPFHWFMEFYGILNNGGFDCIIGNPPYVKTSEISHLKNTTEFSCGDLYGFVTKRALQLLNANSRFGFIVMHSLVFSKNFKDVRALLKEEAATAWFSFYGRIPAGLFSGDARVRNCIFLFEKRAGKNRARKFYTTRLQRWFAGAREQLLYKLKYSVFSAGGDALPMLNDETVGNYFTFAKGRPLSSFETRASAHTLHFKQSAYNWVAISPEPAPCFDGRNRKIPQTKVGNFSLDTEETKKFALLFLNGKVFFARWLTFGDEFDVTKNDITDAVVPFENITVADKKRLLKLADEFEAALESTIQYKLNAGKNVGTCNTSKLWRLTDQSDRIFLKYQCDNPDEVFASVEEHIAQTVITGTNDNHQAEDSE